MKAALFGLIVCCLAAMWFGRAQVIEAYRTESTSPEVRLSGVDLAIGLTPIGPSPWSPPTAPDGRSAPAPALLPAVADDDDEPEVAMSGGTATLRGTVVGPDGPVIAAVVEIQRQTSSGVGVRRVTTGEDGTWLVRGMPGGRYRVRAWLPGLLSMGGSEVRFVDAGQVEDYTFSLWGVDPSPALELVDAGPIYEGSTGEVAVVASRRSIDSEGLIITTPIPSVLVTVEVTSDVVLASGAQQITGTDGAARFVIGCPAPGVVLTPPGTTLPANPPTTQTTATTAPTTPPASPNGDGSSTTIGGTTLLGTDTMVARATFESGLVMSTFRLPGCQPVPEPTAPAASPEGDGTSGAIGAAGGTDG